VEKEIKEKIKNRQKANSELVKKLSELVIAYPDLRFGQILVNFGFIKQIVDHYDCSIVLTEDPFNEESIDTLKRVKEYGRNS
jgi:hypothetical protein